MNKSEIRYEKPLKVKALETSLHIIKDTFYMCIGEYVMSNGKKLLAVVDSSKFDNLHSSEKFAIIGEWEDRKIEDKD